jgi:hypothetical protein
MKFTLEIDLENAAFECHSPKFRNGQQVARILRVLAHKLEAGYHLNTSDIGKLLDGNGNTIGRWTVDE